MTVNLPLVAAQQQVYDLLNGAVTVVVVEGEHNVRPAITLTAPINGSRARLPYIDLRVEGVSDESTLDDVAHGVSILVDVFTGPNPNGTATDYLGSEVVYLFMEAITATIMGVDFEVQGWHIYSPERELAEAFEEGSEASGGDWHGVLRFSYLVDQR